MRTALLLVLAARLAACAPPPPAAPGYGADPFLDSLQRRTSDWFWDTTDPATGLTPDRWPTPSFSSVAAIGFALTGYPVAAERGFAPPAEARARVLATLRYLWQAPQHDGPTAVTGYNGFFYHFLDMQTGSRFARVELSTIDTALLMAGVLFCQSYYAGDHAEEREIRDLAERLYRRVNWQWAVVRPPLVSMGWHPETGFIPHDYEGYDEAMILYMLALGSPTHPIAPEAWPAFTRTYRWADFYGYEHVNFAPLFGHQYSHIWIDTRGIRDAYMRDRGIDYFENARRAARSQHAYAADNPGGWRGYGPLAWGLTACDGPADTTLTLDGRTRALRTYWARGAAHGEIHDDGTLAPTAAGGSLPFAPEIALPALKHFRDRYGDRLYTRYGFLDAFNPTLRDTSVRVLRGRIDPEYGWFNPDYLGIDQGPILLMIENYRNGFVWETMKRNPHLVRGLCRAGFTGGWLEGRCP